MAGLTIDIKELRELEKQLLNAPKELKQRIDLEAKGTANDVERYAKKLVPVYKGETRAGMYNEKISDASYKVGNNVAHAPFVEFGTGQKVFIRPEWESFASQFKGKKGVKWDDALADITEWCKKKGIPVEAAYPILVTILNDGINANPFLYPAFKYGRKELYDKIKKLVAKFGLDE